MFTVKRILIAAVALICLFMSSMSAVAQPTYTNANWSRSYVPFRIAGNLYYVGTYDLACYLVATPKGHILINTAINSTVPMLRANVESLGFKFSDIKILLISQAHFDHTGGLAEIQKLTHAKVMIDEKDVPVVADGGNSDYLFGGKGVGSLFTPVRVDRKLRDHDIIELGGTRLELLHHPGHTKGSCSYLLTVKDERRSYRVLIANIPYMLDDVILPGMPTYLDAGKDFLQTYATMKKLKFDIWVAAHCSQFGLHELRKETDGYKPELFGDKERYLATIQEMEDVYNEHLKAKE